MKKTEDELWDLLAKCPSKGALWRHYKGGLYRVAGAAIAEATQEPVVIYQPLLMPGIRFTRPLSEWVEMVETEHGTVPRYAITNG